VAAPLCRGAGKRWQRQTREAVKTHVLLEDEPSAARPISETPLGGKRSPPPLANNSPGISNFQQSNANRAKK